MSIGEIISLTGIIVAFTVFAVVLAWGEHQTRNLSHNAGKAANSQPTTATKPAEPARQRASFVAPETHSGEMARS